MTAPPTLGLVVPAYRPDPDVLTTYLQRLEAVLSPATLRVELDVPEPAVVERLGETTATVATSNKRRGKGAAITAGFAALETDVLAFADADGSTPARQVSRVVAPVTEGTADVAVGSRRHPEATVESSQTRARASMGDGFAWLARRLLDVQLYDYQCGAKALTAAAWDRLDDHLTESGFAWDVELLALAGAMDMEIREVPIVWQDHPDSTVPPVRTALDLARALVRARYRTRRVRTDAQTSPESESNGTEDVVGETPSKHNE